MHTLNHPGAPLSMGFPDFPPAFVCVSHLICICSDGSDENYDSKM